MRACFSENRSTHSKKLLLSVTLLEIQQYSYCSEVVQHLTIWNYAFLGQEHKSEEVDTTVWPNCWSLASQDVSIPRVIRCRSKFVRILDVSTANQLLENTSVFCSHLCHSDYGINSWAWTSLPEKLTYLNDIIGEDTTYFTTANQQHLSRPVNEPIKFH